MKIFNVYGMIFVILILIPNVIFAYRHADGFENLYKNKTVEILEQIGRFGSFILMIFLLPRVCIGFSSEIARKVYIIAGFSLVFLYILGWIVFRDENSVRKSLVLSVLPSVLLLESGILSLNTPLIVTAAIFAPCHILISFMNAKLKAQKPVK